MKRITKKMTDLYWDKFQEKVIVNEENGCHEFLTRRGEYGVFHIWKDGKITRLPAHRVAWVYHMGCQIPHGQLVLHKCDNPPCVNFDHLFLGTYYDNRKDMVRKRRGIIPGAKLTETMRNEIIDLVHSGVRYKTKDIAARYGVSYSVINDFLRGRSYRNIGLRAKEDEPRYPDPICR